MNWKQIVALSLAAVVLCSGTGWAQTMEQHWLSKAKTDLSRRAVSLKMSMSRTEVLDTLGSPPTWVFLPDDAGDWALDPGVFLELMWDNGPCPPVMADFNAEGKLTGFSGGLPADDTCSAGATAYMVPPRGRYGCKERERRRYCESR